MKMGKWTIQRCEYETGNGYYVEWAGEPRIASFPVPKYWWARPYALVAGIWSVQKMRKAYRVNND